MTSDGLRHQVCTLEGTEKKWVGTQLKTVGVLGHAVAVGHCLAARLGYDRSGYARAVVPRKGMPHYPTSRDVLRGTGTIEEREQLQKSAAVPVPKLDPATCERGDLIVKVPVKLPRDRTRPQRLCLVEGVLHLPPVVLLTSAPAIGAQRSGERLVPAAPLAVLFTHTLLPALLTLIAIRRRRAGVPVSAPSIPVVFNGSGGGVSDGAFGSCGAVAASEGGEAGAGAGATGGAADTEAGAAGGAADTGAGAAGGGAADAEAGAAGGAAGTGAGAAGGAAGTGAGAAGGAAGTGAGAAGSLSIEAIEAIREALFASDIELADGMTRWPKVVVEAFFESGGDMSVVHRMREAAPATMEVLTTAPSTMEAQGSVTALSPRAIRGTQRHSEALRGTQRHSEALRGTIATGELAGELAGGRGGTSSPRPGSRCRERPPFAYDVASRRGRA